MILKMIEREKIFGYREVTSLSEKRLLMYDVTASRIYDDDIFFLKGIYSVIIGVSKRYLQCDNWGF